MTIDRPAGSTLVDLLSEETFTVEAGGQLRVPVQPYQARILVPPEQRVAGL
jgi:hypothetical protein